MIFIEKVPNIVVTAVTANMGFKMHNSWPKTKQVHNLLKLTPKMAMKKPQFTDLRLQILPITTT